MDLLWQKETKNHELYVDIFKNKFINSKDVHAHLKKISKITARMNALKLTEKCDGMSSDFRSDGNAKFKEKKWFEAMSFYNQSLCFAKTGSENVSLAYANRSTCFFHLEMYDKCLVDIELAKQANYPINLIPKLDKRREDCLKRINTFEKNKHKLSYEADEQFPGMANVLEIRCDKKFGRHIIAKCDIPVGKIVLAEKPFITRFINTQYNACTVCMNVSMNFIACTQCTTALYCNSGCANANNLHKMDCTENWQGKNSPLQYYVAAILFIISIFTNIDSLIEFVEEAVKIERLRAPHSLKDMKSKLRALLQFSSNNCATAEKSSENMREAYMVYSSLQLRQSIKTLFDTEEEKRFLMHLTQHLICVMSNNGFSVKNSVEISKMSTYMISSYFNHACALNVLAMTTNENVRYCKTTRPFKAGQQLFVTYLGEIFCEESEEYCQTFLYDNFGFRCKCERCKPNMIAWEMNSYSMQLDYNYQLINQKYIEFMNDGVGTEEEKKIFLEKVVVDVLNRFGDKHWCDELAAAIEFYENYL